MNQSVKLIGIGDGGPESLLPIYQRWIDESERLVGGERHLAFFPQYKGEIVAIKGNLEQLLERLQKEPKNTVILASGDPLFYGIGNKLSSSIGLEIYPHVSSIQLAFAKIGEPWQDAYVTSIHGRSMKGLAQRIDGKSKVAVLTDKVNTPVALADYLLSFGMNEYRLFVAENLGSETEKSGWYNLEEVRKKEFSPLNIVILKKSGLAPRWPVGINDEEFFQRKPEKGLMTKKEVRLLSLAALGLQADSIVWDIGTCTGSLAIEAARIAREGIVYAIEKNINDLANCQKNMMKFRADLTLVHGKAPDGLSPFADPDAVFIGGASDALSPILDVCCDRLRPGGKIVINAATIEKLNDAVTMLKERKFSVSITLVQISKSKPVLQLTRFAAYNPIYIITGTREGES
ncbi:precorrin-6y C5,15-methyltransferase (decarboxylating) subunit CbiE [Neobacillus sp. OS1-32]|uniref:precorrin-6y C5,15-methyltransferase (decarboxylating) subunit CbiE n=1 Tax=Neobacillus sp. OS1-32 TaxID=3070682 RepID=UPI0027E18C65|nr:precorrin-6y C5,15-methyltransferase (decarboxylating) subunit CbiE [Neobacillus sp. OS1-32]WML29137.1 precorrin-6y C5,15-methyltransferase (decarboxylating) subunit CbiE [Neobacillus sp. OS1-32]